MSVHAVLGHLYQPGCSPKEQLHGCHEYIKVVCVWNPCKHRWEEHIETIKCVWDPCKHRFVETIVRVQVVCQPIKEFVRHCWQQGWEWCGRGSRAAIG